MTITVHQTGSISARWPSAAGNVCAPNRIPKSATARAMTTSRLATLMGRLGCFCPGWGGSATGRSGAIERVDIHAGQDAVFDSPAQQVNLGGRGTPDLHVLHADAVEVLARGRVADAELLG